MWIKSTGGMDEEGQKGCGSDYEEWVHSTLDRKTTEEDDCR